MPKRKRRKSNLTDQLRADYATALPIAQRFVSAVGDQIDSLLARDEVALAFPMQQRVKTLESLLEKLERRELVLTSVRELHDLVGFRLILQFRRDVSRVCEMLRRTFDVVDQYDTLGRMREDQFGYASIHFVVQLPETWLAVPTMSDMGGFRAEIQVRTTAQHIWAAASHTLQYKNEASVPPEIRRAISRVSALLETVDLELERVLAEREHYVASLDNRTDPDEILNVDLVQKVLDEIWPAANKMVTFETYAELLEQLTHFNIVTRQALTGLLTRHREAVLADEAKRLDEARTTNEEWAASPIVKERVTSGVFLTHTGLTRIAFALEFGDDWRRYQATFREKRGNA